MKRTGWIIVGLALAAGFVFGCSPDEKPPVVAPPPAAATPVPDAAEQARAELEKAARELQAPAAPGTPEAEEARKAVEAMLQDVRQQLQQKAAEIGTVPPADPPKP